MSGVLVAGATGYLGRYVARAFKARGDRVRVLARDPSRLARPGPSLAPAVADLVDEVFVGEVTRPKTLRGLCEGVEVVFSSVGVTRQADGPSPMEVDYRGNRNLLDAALAASVRKFVFVHVFNAPLLAGLETVRAKRRFIDDLRASGLGSAVVCPTGFFGDMAEFLRMARRGAVYQIGDGRARINPIHGADLAEVCVDAAAGDRAEVAAGGPEVLSYREIAGLAFDALGEPPRIRRVPAWAVKLLLAALRPAGRRHRDLADGIATIAQHDFVAPPCGTHTLRAFYRDLAPTLG